MIFPSMWRLPDMPGVRDGPKDLKQVWFAGVHSDVGGGYSESESALSKIPLNWMMQEAKASGLRVDSTRELEVLGARYLVRARGVGDHVEEDVRAA
jgi:uncharacterized protein (DUF2235 family)